MQVTNLSCAASRELAEEVLVPPLALAALPDDPQADNPTAIVPASAQVAKARRQRPWVNNGEQADCISCDS
jgi:hypothetical protein